MSFLQPASNFGLFNSRNIALGLTVLAMGGLLVASNPTLSRLLIAAGQPTTSDQQSSAVPGSGTSTSTTTESVSGSALEISEDGGSAWGQEWREILEEVFSSGGIVQR